METLVLTEIFLLIILIIFSAFFSTSETALTSVSRIRMMTLQENGRSGASRVLKLIENKDEMLTAILIGNNIVNIGASSLATSIALGLYGDAGVAVATGVMTILVLIFGEITPKTIATAHAESISLATSSVILPLVRIMRPLILIFMKITDFLISLLGVKKSSDQPTVSEDELFTIIDVGHEEGIIEHHEKNMITNIFRFTDIRVKDVMIPHIDIAAVEIGSSYSEVLETFRGCGYSKLPVYSKTIDDIRGILVMRDFILYKGEEADFRIEDLMQEPMFIYEAKKASDLFREMNTRSKNVAVVIDEFGSTAGLVTLNDLAAVVFGELAGEVPEASDQVVKVTDYDYIVSGRMYLNDLDDLLHLDLDDKTESQTIAGFVMESLGHVPAENEFVNFEGNNYTVLDVCGNRVERIRIHLSRFPDTDKDNSKNEKTKES